MFFPRQLQYTFSESFQRSKHVAHVLLFTTVLVLFQLGALGLWADIPGAPTCPPLMALLLQLLRMLPLLALPQAVFNLLGLISFNAFPERTKLKGSPLLAPFICIRVVTRGDYPDLVRQNINRNILTCQKVGLEKFIVEVATDKKIDLPDNKRVRQVIVPSSYKPKSGALFKARALQYCLEEDINILSDSDWIVHLDEETIVTEASVRGILNFVMDSKHQFGQGLITYANETIQNWFTTLADSFRVSDDMGKLRFQFKMFHKPLFGWKGSYVVTQVGAERKISFDHGPDGSVAEDNFFAMIALKERYSFDFIEGDMWEKSPFTIYDFLQQRKRWLQGILLVVHSSQIPTSELLAETFMRFTSGSACSSTFQSHYS